MLYNLYMSQKADVNLRLPRSLIDALDASGMSRSEAAEIMLSAGLQAQRNAEARSRKTSFTLRVSPDLRELLGHISASQNFSLQDAAVMLLMRGAETMTDDQSQAALGVVSDQIRATVGELDARHDAHVHRLAYLLTQATLESLTTQELMLSVLVMLGVSPDEAQRQRDDARGTAAKRLTNKSEQMRDLLRELAAQV